MPNRRQGGFLHGKSVEPLHIFTDVRGHAAADVGLISLEEIAEPLVVVDAGCGIVGLDEGLDHGVQLLLVLFRVIILLGNLDENLVVGVQDLHFAGAGGVESVVEDIAGLLHILLRGRRQCAVIAHLRLHLQRELHTATDIDTPTNIVSTFYVNNTVITKIIAYTKSLIFS